MGGAKLRTHHAPDKIANMDWSLDMKEDNRALNARTPPLLFVISLFVNSYAFANTSSQRPQTEVSSSDIGVGRHREWGHVPLAAKFFHFDH